MDRFPIYVRLGVPELWCYDAGRLTVYQQHDEQYVEVEQSTIFPQLKLQELPQLIENNRLAGRLVLRRSIRAWVNAQVRR